MGPGTSGQYYRVISKRDYRCIVVETLLRYVETVGTVIEGCVNESRLLLKGGLTPGSHSARGTAVPEASSHSLALSVITHAKLNRIPNIVATGRNQTSTRLNARNVPVLVTTSPAAEAIATDLNRRFGFINSPAALMATIPARKGGTS
jgi:hypothetical protein